ncbi:MAG: class I SAM-dependent methyltransferase [Myxococcaceae bacterium]
MDPFSDFKTMQRQAWSTFAPMEAFTTPPAAKLVAFARVKPGQTVLDVGCGTGVVAITAARQGARVVGLDLTPELLESARDNAKLAGAEVEWVEGDAESLPFEAARFDVVLSQFGHMFAPRPEVAVSEMLRVLKPGGTLAFSTWPPELFTGRMFALTSQYAGGPPPGVAPPPQWGDPNVVRQRLGDAVTDLTFDRGLMQSPALSPAHNRAKVERFAGPVKRFVESSPPPAHLAAFRRELEALISEYMDGNVVRQEFLMTRARKLSTA